MSIINKNNNGNFNDISFNDTTFLNSQTETDEDDNINNLTRKTSQIRNVSSHVNLNLTSTQTNLICTKNEININSQFLANLSSWGLPENVLIKYQERGISKMFAWQVECLGNKNVLENNSNLVYSAPTSAGKTLVAEILALKTVLEKQKKVIIILPFVSVVREKMFYFQDILSLSGIRVEGFMGSHTPPGGFKAVQFAICTIEKANSIINKLLEEGTLSDIGAVIIDELHLLGDSNRGYLLELLLTKLRYMSSRNDNIHIQLIGMSATLSNLDLLAKWLSAEMYTTNFRPIPLEEFCMVSGEIYNNQFKLQRRLEQSPDLKEDTDNILQLCLETINLSCSVLIFCPTKNWCENLAQQISVAFCKLGNSKSKYGLCLREQLNSSAIMEILEQLKHCPVGLDAILKRTVSFGVAFHHAGLTIDERDIIEGAFRNGALRVLVATSTLSSGVNLPAQRVIIRTPMFHGKPIDLLTYRQMTGRAGRMGKDTSGESILVCQKNNKRITEELMSSVLYPIESCLEGAGKLKRAILEVIASGVATTPDDIKLFTNCTLLAASLNGIVGVNNPIDKALDFLVKNEFIRLQTTEENELKYVPTSLAKACLTSSLPPEDGLILFEELEKARQCFVLNNDLHLLYLVTPYSVCSQWSSLDWMLYLDIWEKLSPNMKRIAELVGVQEAFIFNATRGRINSNSSKGYHKLQIHRRFYTALALQDLVNEIPLNEVADKFKCSRGMLQSLQQSASMFAGMVTTFCCKLGWKCVEILISQFQDRLQFGIQHELLDLMKLPNLNGPRARILYSAGIQSLAELAAVDVCKLENMLISAVPFESEKERDGESTYDVEQKKKLRGIFITGKQGLTAREAASMLIKDARTYLQLEIGAEMKWESTIEENNTTNSNNSSQSDSKNIYKDSIKNNNPKIKRPAIKNISEKYKNAIKNNSNINGNNERDKKEIINKVNSHSVNSKSNSQLVLNKPENNNYNSTNLKFTKEKIIEKNDINKYNAESNEIINKELKTTNLVNEDATNFKNGTNNRNTKLVNNVNEKSDKKELCNSDTKQNKLIIVKSDIAKSHKASPSKYENLNNNSKNTTPKKCEKNDKLIKNEINKNELQLSSFNTNIEKKIFTENINFNNTKSSSPIIFGSTNLSNNDHNELKINTEIISVCSNKENINILSNINTLSIQNTSSSLIEEIKSKTEESCSNRESLSSLFTSDFDISNTDELDDPKSTEKTDEQTNGNSLKVENDVAFNWTPLECDILSLTESPSNSIKLKSLQKLNNSDLNSSNKSGSLFEDSLCLDSKLCDALDLDQGIKDNEDKDELKLGDSSFFDKCFDLFNMEDQNDDIDKQNENVEKEEQIINVEKEEQIINVEIIDNSQTSTENISINSPFNSVKKNRKPLLKTPRKRNWKEDEELNLFDNDSFEEKTPKKKQKNNHLENIVIESDCNKTFTIESKKVYSSTPVDLTNLNIIDVCRNKKLFETFSKDLSKMSDISFAVACEKFHVEKPRIGQQIIKPSTSDQKTNEPNNKSITVGNRLIAGLAITCGENTIYFLSLTDEEHVTNKEKLKLIQTIVDNKNLNIRIFDYKEQVKVFYRSCNIVINCKMEDPKVADWLIKPEEKEKNLQAMALKYSPKAVGIAQLAGNCKGVGSIALDVYSAILSRIRASVEAIVTWHIIESQRDILAKQNVKLIDTFQIEMQSTNCLAQMELTGLYLNTERMNKLINTIQEQMAILQQKAFSLAGRHFSFVSSKDVAKVLGIYKGKRVSTNKQVLEQIQNPIANLISQWRKLNCTLTKMLFPIMRSIKNNRIHGCCVTNSSTGRISMHEPNLQNIPRNFEIVNTDKSVVSLSVRSTFMPTEEKIFVSADYCQLELRILAHMSQDTGLCDIMRTDGDIFKSIAAKINQIPENEVNDTLRQRAKQLCYGIIYGMGLKALSEQLNVSEEEAQVFMDSFKNTYPKINVFIQETVKFCKENNYVETLAGRRRYLPCINDENSTNKCQAERQAVNTTIQGSAADIAKKAMVLIDSQLRKSFPDKNYRKSRISLVLHLHDELLYETPQKDLTQVAKVIKNVMEQSIALSIPFPVKLKRGTSWGELEEFSI